MRRKFQTENAYKFSSNSTPVQTPTIYWIKKRATDSVITNSMTPMSYFPSVTARVGKLQLQLAWFVTH
jgi:hypothetical protein